MTEKHETKPNDFLSNIWVSTKWRLGKRVPAKQYIFLFMRFSFQQYTVIHSYAPPPVHDLKTQRQEWRPVLL